MFPKVKNVLKLVKLGRHRVKLRTAIHEKEVENRPKIRGGKLIIQKDSGGLMSNSRSSLPNKKKDSCC
jgi:hypothetical protein